MLVAQNSAGAKPSSRFRWTIKGKAEFAEAVSNLHDLNNNLEAISLRANESQLLQRGLPPQTLAGINNQNILSLLSNPTDNFNKDFTNVALILAARAKSLQQLGSAATVGRIPAITEKQVKIIKDSEEASIGILTIDGGHSRPVWVEWNGIRSGSGSNKYVERINALGYLLQQVSESDLRLLPCHGVYEDYPYQISHGIRRVGYVFGVPRNENGQTYDRDLIQHPPITMREIIRDQRKTPIPLLGDRFHLAYVLASAFGHFHAAGWLHKGFHSGSINFLRATFEPHIDVTQPFITGFQYARPKTGHSLSQGSPEKDELMQYYHPDVGRGFWKRLDLYGLGVVLCEIGRWSLLADMRPERKKTLVDRESWHQYVTGSVVEDLGWRMGKKYQSVTRTLLHCDLPDDTVDEVYFMQMYMEKVLLPLSTCSV